MIASTTSGNFSTVGELTGSGIFCSDKVDDVFIVLTVTLSLLSGLATILNALLIRFLFRVRILHPNVHLLLKNLAIAVFLSGLFMFVRLTSYHAFLIVLGFDRMKIDSTICSLIEGPFAVCCIALITSIVVIGFERLVATMRGRLDSERSGFCTKFMTVMTWVVGLLNCVFFYIYVFVNPKTVCYCQVALISSAKALNVNIMTYVVLELTVVFVYWYVYHRNCNDYANFTINTARHNLHERFQMLNNIQTTRMLLPVVIVHALFYTISLLSITVLRSVRSDNDVTTVNLLLTVIHLIVLEMVVQPLLIIRRSERLKQVAHELCPNFAVLWGKRTHGDGASKSGELTAADTTVIDYRMKPETHQDILDQIWSAKPMLGQQAKKSSVRKFDLS